MRRLPFPACSSRLSSALLVLLAACQVQVPIPAGQADALAREIATIGHPAGRYVATSVVGGSTGWFGGSRSIDLAIRYVPLLGGDDEEIMTVRLHVENLSPCSVRSEVLDDTGPPPILLDNRVASPHVGRMVCALFSEEQE